MSWIDRLDAKLGRYAVPNITVLLIAGQVVAYVLNNMPREPGTAPVLASIQLVPSLVLSGEWWRLITYVFDPPPSNVLFAVIFWYLFYLMGSTLEAQWGALRYNLYLLLGYLASVAMTFATYFAFGAADAPASNLYLQSTVFLAFARLYPDFTVMLFFLLPVKVRWLALLTWIIFGVTLLFSQSWLERGLVVGAVFNYLVFFGRDIARDMRHSHKRMQFQSRALPHGKKRGRKMAHVCHVCGLSSADSPKTAFRYCSECGGAYCYCPEHIGNHEHVKVSGD
jgi:membrane associated rhomboid family serine protease